MSDTKRLMQIGDTVQSKFGDSKIKRIELLKHPYDDEGLRIDQIEWAKQDMVIVDLENGHWSYGRDLYPTK